MLSQIIFFTSFYLRMVLTTTSKGYGHILTTVTVLSLLIVKLGAVTAPPVIAPTNKYINIYTININTASFASMTTLTQYSVIQTLNSPQADLNFRMGNSIGSLNFNLPTSRNIYYEVDVGAKTTTNVELLISTNSANKINLMVVYLLILQPRTVQVYFHYGYYTIGSTFSQGQSYTRTVTSVTSQPVSTSSMYYSIIGLDFVAPSSLQVGFKLTVTQINTWDVNVTITSISAKSTMLYYFSVMYFTYNNPKLLAETPAARYTAGSFSATGGNNALLMVTDTNNVFRLYNTIIGMSSFWVTGLASLNFVAKANPSVSITATSNNTWTSFSFNYLFFEFFYCADNTPFLMVPATLCYDLCPIRYASNTSDYQCDNCPTVDCYYCGNNGLCTVCNATLDFRYLDNATKRCLPLPGYYESGVSTATPCVATNCLTCTSATYCLSCQLGKYLTSTHTCATCMSNCLNCTSATTCVQCASYYIFSVNACVTNCTNITNCVTCTVSSGILCSTCVSGYSVINNTCVTVCGDNILIASTEACDDGNFDNGDGCSSTCTIETKFYCDNTVLPRVCGHCVANCDTCTNPTVCVGCSVGYTPTSGLCTLDCTVVANCSTCEYNGTMNATACLTCQTGYTLQSNNTCTSTCGDGIRVSSQGCDDGNINATDGCSPTCTVQATFYCTDNYPSTPLSTCAHCINFCQACSNATSCDTCDTGYTYVSATSACTIDCSPIPNCVTCGYTTYTTCTLCATGYHIDISNSSCGSLCGDGYKNGAEACDDGNLNATDGCSPTCTIQATFFCADVNVTGGVKSTCTSCVGFCQVCSSNTSCSTCDTGYAYNTTAVACTVDCTAIANCITCTYTSNVTCTDCAAGYHIDNANNVCITQCGDGFKNGAEGCDDGNLNNTDGCSSTCTIQSAFYCVDTNITGGIKSTCSACIAFCNSCINSTACDTCGVGYAYSPTNNSCNIDCSNITLCTACNFTGGLNCEACQTGYYVLSNICTPRCGDGILLPIENCDDGNNVTGDGCSSTCIIEPAFLCSNSTNATTTFTYTTCAPCMAHCVDCTGNVNDCQQCQLDYIYSTASGSISCIVDCSTFLDCSACTITQCTACSANHAFDSSNTCVPICGDGKLLLGQICDDGNTANGDGCSSTCQVQSNFMCQTAVQTSVCSLLSMSISPVSVNKDPAANSVAIQYLINPSSLPALSTLDWSNVVYQQSNLSLAFSSTTYDSSTGQLTINANYAQDLNFQLLQVGFNFPGTAPFNLLNATNASTVLVSDNNLSLQAYSDDTYSGAKILEYCALGTSCLALGLFLLGYFSGKLIGLQCITVFQLTFLSLLTFQNLSPLFASLSMLSYSCGYNMKDMQSSQVNLGRRFKTVNFNEPFLSNYNLTVALVVLPLLLSLIMAIINRLRYQSANPTLIKYSQLLRGEFCFYGLMFSAYDIILSLGIQVGHIGSGMVGLAAGGCLVLVILAYSVLLHKKPEIFGEFSEKFNKESVIQSHYYCFLVVERVLTTGGLLMMFFNPQGAIIVAMLAIQIVLVLWKQPYKGERAWLRPFLNLLISALIQAVFILDPMLSKSMPIYSKYAPYAVIGLLAVTLLYNVYYFIQNLRSPEKPEAKLDQEEGDLMKQQFSKLDLFQKKIMQSPKLAMLDKSCVLELEEPGSPSKLSGDLLNEVRGKLSKVKMNTVDISNISMVQDISFAADDQI